MFFRGVPSKLYFELLLIETREQAPWRDDTSHGVACWCMLAMVALVDIVEDQNLWSPSDFVAVSDTEQSRAL